MGDHSEGIESKCCSNCGALMSEKDAFCSACGQKHISGKLTIGELLRDAFEAVFNFEAKGYKTLFHLFVPGRLTNEFFKGKHKSYISPLRLFLFMSVVHFSVLTYVVYSLFGDSISKNSMMIERNAFRSEFKDEIDVLIDSLKNNGFAGNASAQAGLDTLAVHIEESRYDSFYKSLFNNDDLFWGKNKFSVVDIYTLSTDSILKKYEVEGFLKQRTVVQAVKVVRDIKNLPAFILSKFPWMVLFMMPALALIIKLLYIRRGQYYVEHLIFSFHYHAFAFFLISIAALLDLWLDTNGKATLIGFLFVFLYLLVAMHAVYEQNWLKTFFKFILLNFCYQIIFTITLSFTLLISIHLL